MPVKWSAPESLCYNAFSSASDAWSFGILLWETVTLGNNPYPDIESKDVLTKLEDGYRMPEPANCGQSPGTNFCLIPFLLAGPFSYAGSPPPRRHGVSFRGVPGLSRTPKR